MIGIAEDPARGVGEHGQRLGERDAVLLEVARGFKEAPLAAERQVVSRTERAMEKAELRRIWDAVQNKIRTVLMEEWDPIGVNDVPEAADEYDGYIGGIYALLRDRAPDERIVQHLWEIETKTMGLTPVDRPSYAQLIARLRSLDLPRLSNPNDLDGG